MPPRRKRAKTAAQQLEHSDIDPNTPSTSGLKTLQRNGPGFLEFHLPGNLRRLQRRFKDAYTGRWLHSLGERNLSWATTNKCFAVAWLDEQTALWGTKCNKLLKLDLRTQELVHIPQPRLPPDTPRPASSENSFGRCGIHNISFNPSRTLMVTGGHDTNDALLFSVPDLQPRKNFIGHQDWVFQACWLNDERFVTGGRDGKLLVWRVDLSDPDLLADTQPVITKDPKMGICRDVACDLTVRRVCAVEPAKASLKLYDINGFRQVDKVTLPETCDTMLLAMRHDTIAVASLTKLTRLDPRMRMASQQDTAHTHVDSQGLRSLQICGHYVSCGGSTGSLSFLDLRMGKWLAAPPPSIDYSWPEELWVTLTHTASKGYLDSSPFLPLDCTDKPPTIYCHAWDSAGLRMLAGGGPQQFGLRGCYAALWQ